MALSLPIFQAIVYAVWVYLTRWRNSKYELTDNSNSLNMSSKVFRSNASSSKLVDGDNSITFNEGNRDESGERNIINFSSNSHID